MVRRGRGLVWMVRRGRGLVMDGAPRARTFFSWCVVVVPLGDCAGGSRSHRPSCSPTLLLLLQLLLLLLQLLQLLRLQLLLAIRLLARLM